MAKCGAKSSKKSELMHWNGCGHNHTNTKTERSRGATILHPEIARVRSKSSDLGINPCDPSEVTPHESCTPTSPGIKTFGGTSPEFDRNRAIWGSTKSAGGHRPELKDLDATSKLPLGRNGIYHCSLEHAAKLPLSLNITSPGHMFTSPGHASKLRLLEGRKAF